jgi:uncharacterized protein YecE (DUF72 family)
MPRVLVGTSGFSYPAWRGSFYPEDLPPRRMLAFYARTFSTVEINNTFYRMPTPALLAGWAAETPAHFRFALKAPQRITHQQRLRDVAEAVATFCAVAARLGAQRGPLLFQLPPHLHADHPRLADLLAALPRDVEAAVEFRHPSWLGAETYRLLERHGAALCIAESEGCAPPLVATAAFGYLRLRRGEYTPAELAAWAARIAAERRWRRAYVYFKHDDAGRAPVLARAFLAQLGGTRQRATPSSKGRTRP